LDTTVVAVAGSAASASLKKVKRGGEECKYKNKITTSLGNNGNKTRETQSTLNNKTYPFATLLVIEVVTLETPYSSVRAVAACTMSEAATGFLNEL